MSLVHSIRLYLSGGAGFIGGLFQALAIWIHPMTVEEMVMHEMEEQVEDDLAEIFGDFDENFEIDSPLTDEDDYAGTEPGEWKDMNPSAQTLFKHPEEWGEEDIEEYMDGLEAEDDS